MLDLPAKQRRPWDLAMTATKMTTMMMMATMMTMILKMVMMIIMAFRQIPTMTKSHHGGNLSLMAMVGFCHQHIPTMVIHNDEAGLLI